MGYEKGSESSRTGGVFHVVVHGSAAVLHAASCGVTGLMCPDSAHRMGCSLPALHMLGWADLLLICAVDLPHLLKIRVMFPFSHDACFSLSLMCGGVLHQELKKPLRVTFLSSDGQVAEEGVDHGGVRREFFQLLVAELFSPDFGMFVEVEESNSMWFNTASLESLVGSRRFPGLGFQI